MTDEEFIEAARRFAVDWLNSMASELDPLPDDYITKLSVLSVVPYEKNDERLYVFEAETDDDPPNGMMFCHMSPDGEIIYATWYFDGSWGEMKGGLR